MSLYSRVSLLPLRLRIALSLANTAVGSLDIRIGWRGFAVSWKRIAAPSRGEKLLGIEAGAPNPAASPYPPPV